MAVWQTLMHTRLSGASGVQALVAEGTSPETYRISPAPAPEDMGLPLVAYQRILGGPLQAMADATDLERLLVQVDCYAATHQAAWALAEAVRVAMAGEGNGFFGRQESAQDEYEERSGLFRVLAEYVIWLNN